MFGIYKCFFFTSVETPSFEKVYLHIRNQSGCFCQMGFLKAKLYCDRFILYPGGGVHNVLTVRVCAAHMAGILGPKFSKQGSLFR